MIKDKFGRVMSIDVCSEDCIHLSDLANDMIDGNQAVGYMLRNTADRYRQLLDLLYSQRVDPFRVANGDDTP